MGAVYTQLSIQERRKIEDWWLAKVPVAEMARVLRRCASGCRTMVSGSHANSGAQFIDQDHAGNASAS